MRRTLSVMASLAALVGVVGACRLTSLQVGDDPEARPDTGEAGAPDVRVVESGAKLTFEETLRAKCDVEGGPNDAYYSAKELTERLVGRWFICDSTLMSSLNDGAGDAFAFNADGTWALLRFNEARNDFIAETVDPYNCGKVRYHSFADPDAGAAADAGVTSKDVERDDPTPRTSLVVYLDRIGAGGPDPQSFTFSKNPRQMVVVEYGPSPLHARYVPVD